MKDPHVLIILKRLPHYRVELFDLLRARLSSDGIILRVCAGLPTAEELTRRDNASSKDVSEVPLRSLKIGGFGGYLHLIPREWLREASVVVAPHENGSLTTGWLLARRHHYGFKVALWGHGPNFSRPDESGPSRWYRRWAIRSADKYFAYTSRSVDNLIAAGLPRSRITVLNNAKRAIGPDAVSSADIEAVRRRLGLAGKHCATVLGSLAADRMLDALFDAALRIRQSLPDFELVIIGDGPLAGDVRQFCSDHPWAHWVGARLSTDMVVHALTGSLLLNPGRVGLNMIDSLAMGLPMVTMNLKTQFPEFAYLDKDRNGFVTDCDSESYANTVIRLFQNPELIDRARDRCLHDAKLYTLDNMADAFATGLREMTRGAIDVAA